MIRKSIYLTLTVVLVCVCTYLALNWMLKQGLIAITIGQEIFTSVVSGAVTALIAFWAAYGMYKIQEDDKVRDQRLEAFIQIKNEVSENRLTIELEAKKEKPLIRLILNTTAWQLGKNKLPIETEKLLDGLKLLYDDIDRYNWSVGYFRFQVMEKNATSQTIPDSAWKSITAIIAEMVEKLREFEKLTARELVLLKQYDKKLYEERFGAFEHKVKISYFS